MLRPVIISGFFFAFFCVWNACFSGMGRVQAQSNPPPSAVQVIEQENLASIGSFRGQYLYHGYQTLHFDLKNTDSSRAHEAVVRSGGIQKSFRVPAGQTIHASFSIPPVSLRSFSKTEIRFDDSSRVYSFNNVIYPVQGFNDDGFYSSVDRKNLGVTRLLASSELKNAFMDLSIVFPNLDIALWPTDRLDYSPYDCLAITESELVRAPQDVQNAIRDWVAAGGVLWIFKATPDGPLNEIPWLKRTLDSFDVQPPLNQIGVKIVESKEKNDNSDETVPDETVPDETVPDETAPDEVVNLDQIVGEGKNLEAEILAPRSCAVVLLWEAVPSEINKDFPSEKKREAIDEWLTTQDLAFQIPVRRGYWGFGQILALEMDPKAFFEKNNISVSNFISGLDNQTIGFAQERLCWFFEESLEAIHAKAPIVESLSLPLISIFPIMIAFALVAGPLSCYLLARRNLRIFLLVTVPALSFITAGGVLAFIIVYDGFSTDYRYAATTYLDQKEGMAATIGQFGYYARTSPSVVTYDAQTELFPLINRIDYPSYYGHSPVDRKDRQMNWTARQELGSGWISPRTPTYFKFRKTVPCRLKLTFEFSEKSGLEEAGQTLTVTNGLGAPIKRLTVYDDQGRRWRGLNIAPGAKSSLFPESEEAENSNFNVPWGANPQLFRFFKEGSWFHAYSLDGERNSYWAELDTSGQNPSPFLEKGISYAKQHNSSETVVGTF